MELPGVPTTQSARAAATVGRESEGEQAGFSDHIVKPISIAQLEEAIRRVTVKRRVPDSAGEPD